MRKKNIEDKIGEVNRDINYQQFSLGGSVEEKDYRSWCLDNRLFLNSLNDIGSFSIGGRDILHIGQVSGNNPSHIVSCVGFFNQIKQEYVSARYFLYEGIKYKDPHFSDKDVYLVNTLDYPNYSINSEKVRVAVRMAYSLFDKIASFLWYYYDLSRSIGIHKISFNNIWDKLPYSSQADNLLLYGLFHLSKDLDYKSDIYVKGSTDPGAKIFKDMRNKLEHRYLKLHDDTLNEGFNNEQLHDEFANSFYREHFEQKAIILLQKARAALVYLSLAIQQEELRKYESTTSEASIPFGELHFGELEDEWKW